MNDTTLTAREFIREFDTRQPGRYCITRYGKAWRTVIIEAAPDAEPVKAPRPPAPVEVPAVSEVVPAAPVLVAGSPCRMDAKTAALLGRAAPVESSPVEVAPVVNDPGESPAVKAGPPPNFAQWEPERKRCWLKANRRDLLEGELADDNIRAWLAGD